MIVRDHRAAVDNAEHNLENLIVVVSQQTAFALRTTGEGAVAVLLQKLAQEFHGPEHEEFLRRLTTIYVEWDLAYSGRLALLRNDRVLLAVFPRGVGATGRSYATHPLFANALLAAEAGTLQARGIPDRGERLPAYRSVPGYPIVVVASTPMSEILGRWHGPAMVLGFGALLLACLTVMAAYWLGRQLKLTGKLTQDLSESENRLHSIIHSAMDAIITIDEEQNMLLFTSPRLSKNSSKEGDEMNAVTHCIRHIY
jgi:PAS domain-containing protein